MTIGATLGEPWADLDLRVMRDDELLAMSKGEIRKPETFNYRTLKPEDDGLFDTAVFGDYDELKELLAAGLDVQWGVTAATSNFGHIVLAQPVVHPYYATHGLEELADACGWEPQRVRDTLKHVLVHVDGAPTPTGEVMDPSVAVYGAAAFSEVLSDPGAFLIRHVLISPIATRPMVETDGGWATSHVNDLYRRVVNRNNRLRRLLELDAPAIINMNEQRMLQEAVGQLGFNGFDSSHSVTGPGSELLCSLSELARRDMAEHGGKLDAVGPARSVRALRAVQALGFVVGGEGRQQSKPTPTPSAKSNFSLAGAPVPIPGQDRD